MSDELQVKEKKIQQRTYDFALRVIKLCQVLAEDRTGKILANQVLRAGTSIGAK